MTFQPSDPTTLADWLPADAATIGDILRGEEAAAPPPEEEDLPAVTHFAAPTSQGTGDGLSAANAFLISDFIALPPSPGDHLQLKSGTMASPLSYTGVDSIINPDGISGTEADRIIVSCETDGGVLLDGENARDMVNMLNCSWWILQGFNSRNHDFRGVRIKENCHNNILRRVGAWDSPADKNSAVISVGGGVSTPSNDNLVEDCFAFGEGQRMFEFSQGAEGTIGRRLWMIGHTWKAIQFSYQSHENIVENAFGTWESLGHARESEIASRGVLTVGRIDLHPEVISNSKMFGSMAYVLSEADLTAGDHSLHQLCEVMSEQGGLEFRDIVLYAEQQLGEDKLVVLRNLTEPDPLSVYADVTEIKGGSGINRDDTIGTGWTVDNRVIVDTAAEAVSAGANPFGATRGDGAWLMKRYVDGVETDDDLWPWPMDARIRAALTLSGRDPDTIFRGAGNGLTELMESLFNVSLG